MRLFTLVAASLAIAALALSSASFAPVAADASTATSGPNAFAVALDPETGKIIGGGGGGGGGQNKTGRKLSSSSSSLRSSRLSQNRRSLRQDLSEATSGNGFAWSSGGGKSITAGSGAAPGGGGKSCDTATYGNAFAFVGGSAFDWSTAPKMKEAPPIYRACPGEVITFFWNAPSSPIGLTQFSGPGCPSDFGRAAADGKARVLVPPTRDSTSLSLKLEKRGRYFFADPALCKQGVVQEVEV